MFVCSFYLFVCLFVCLIGLVWFCFVLFGLFVCLFVWLVCFGLVLVLVFGFGFGLLCFWFGLVWFGFVLFVCLFVCLCNYWTRSRQVCGGVSCSR